MSQEACTVCWRYISGQTKSFLQVQCCEFDLIDQSLNETFKCFVELAPPCSERVLVKARLLPGLVQYLLKLDELLKRSKERSKLRNYDSHPIRFMNQPHQCTDSGWCCYREQRFIVRGVETYSNLFDNTAAESYFLCNKLTFVLVPLQAFVRANLGYSLKTVKNDASFKA